MSVTAISAPAAQPVDLTPDERIAVAVYQAANRSVVHITTRSQAADDVFGREFMDAHRNGTAP